MPTWPLHYQWNLFLSIKNLNFLTIILYPSQIIFLPLQDGNENTDIPVVHLNLVRLLADLSVFVNKWEVVDMILPLFIESLEEGEASAPNQLRLRVRSCLLSMCMLYSLLSHLIFCFYLNRLVYLFNVVNLFFLFFFLNFQLLDAVSQMACLGFEKSYRETVVLMTRSYLDKLKNLDSAESKTMPPEATTERLEVWLIFLKPLFLHDFCLKDANQKSKTIY